MKEPTPEGGPLISTGVPWYRQVPHAIDKELGKQSPPLFVSYSPRSIFRMVVLSSKMLTLITILCPLTGPCLLLQCCHLH